MKPVNPLLGLIKEANPELSDDEVVALAIKLQKENNPSLLMLAGLARATMREIEQGTPIADVARRFSGYLMFDAETEVRNPQAQTMADVVRLLPTFPMYVAAVLDETPVNAQAFAAILRGMIAMADRVTETDTVLPTE